MKKILATKSLRALLNRLGKFLPSENVEIFYVPTEEDILEFQRIKSVDLIIMGLTEEGDNINKVCSTIRNDKTLQYLPILLICGNCKTSIAKCHICKATAYLTDPVNAEDLLRNILKLLYPETRNDLRVHLQVHVKGETHNNYFFANSKDISISGMQFESNKLFRKGEKVKCLFFLESNQIETVGEIIRAEEKARDLHDYGLKFINLDYKAKELIETFIERNSKNLKSIELQPLGTKQ